MPLRERIYLDYNATTPLTQTARDAMIAALQAPTNASSVHTEGRAARKIVEASRANVAALAGAKSADVTFTSGASEANTMALSPLFRIGADEVRLSRVLIASTAHPSVLAGGRFTQDQIEFIPVNAAGQIDQAALITRLEQMHDDGERALVAVLLANNETGVIEPVADWAANARQQGHLVHVDAVQAVGRMPVDLKALGASSLAISAHKIGGPQGIGSLICAPDIRPAPLITGGGQEGRQRAGTENVAAIAGFGAAARDISSHSLVNLRIFPERDFLEGKMRIMFRTVIIFGSDTERIGNTCCFAISGVAAETLMIALDLEGFAVSSGSACSSGKVGASHVLTAMGVEPNLAGGAIRVSLGDRTSQGEIDRFLNGLRKAVLRIHPSALSADHAV